MYGIILKTLTDYIVDLFDVALDVTAVTMGEFMYDWGVWIIAPIVDIYGSAYVDADWDGSFDDRISPTGSTSMG